MGGRHKPEADFGQLVETKYQCLEQEISLDQRRSQSSHLEKREREGPRPSVVSWSLVSANAETALLALVLLFNYLSKFRGLWRFRSKDGHANIG